MDIKKLRKQYGLSQNMLSRLLSAHPQTVYRWEKGTHQPSPAYKRELIRLVDELQEEQFQPNG